MENLIKNIVYGKAASLADQIDILRGQVISKTLVQNKAVGLTLFAMAAGEGISAHKSTGDAFVLVLAGEMEITIDEQSQRVAAGQFIIMPAGHPHAVKAVTDAKMELTVIFPRGE